MSKYKTGLVLSGGGTRGLAHAGALKFLNEIGVNVDILACCSAGSIVGSLYAVGKNPDEILDFFKSIYFFNWKHFTFNKPGFVSSQLFTSYLDPIFGDTKIGDLKKEIRMIATDLISGEQKIFDKETKVVDAIIASSSIPGIATPYIVGDAMYSDGGVLNNFPADIILSECKNMIGIYVTPIQDVKMSDLNTIRAITTRAYDLLSHRTEIHKFAYCDWFITSKKLAQYGTFERKLSRLEEIFEIGYECAKKSFYDQEEDFTSLFLKT